MKIRLEQFVEIVSRERNKKNDSSQPLYNSLFRTIKRAIVSGAIPHSSILPPTRKLADALSISRSTVVTVYDLLRLEKLVESKAGSGYKVVYRQPSPVEDVADGEKLESQLSDLGKSFFHNVHRVNVLDPGQMAFRPGLPPIDVFPINTWKRLINQFWQLVRARDLNYYPENGLESLRSTLANYLSLTRGIPCHKDQIMIVGGSLQSLYLIGALLINPGDTVMMENPTFPNVHSLFTGLRSEIIGLKPDRSGISLKAVDRESLSRTKLLHATPSCQYPLGMQMSFERRKELVEQAHEHDFVIIENDYEHEINGMEQGVKTIFSLDSNDRTFYLGTFNRILHPSIRLGYMVVPRHLINPIRAIARHSHLMVSASTQTVLDEFIQRDYLYRHVQRVKEIALERQAVFEDLMKEKCARFLEPVNRNIQSLHKLYFLSEEHRDKKFLEKLAKENIVAHGLSKCYISNRQEQGLIFGYSCARPSKIKSKLNNLKLD